MIAFCALTIVLAIYTVMPKVGVRLRRPDAPDLDATTSNPLFFGDFVHLDYPQYLAGMEQVMSDAYHTYEAQVREVYALGRFLATRKYRYLRYAYLAFLTGVIASGITLAVVLLLEARRA